MVLRHEMKNRCLCVCLVPLLISSNSIVGVSFTSSALSRFKSSDNGTIEQLTFLWVQGASLNFSRFCTSNWKGFTVQYELFGVKGVGRSVPGFASACCTRKRQHSTKEVHTARRSGPSF
ncbi:hypothetical protein B0H66DRAFT_568308 [Apodospora peruviana]|uniref:Uncharacterized protein n=1 Tax=Apodospora peruviana TaxID=516989 RepID=A0AAE0HWV3_9PEZI|nr:hypothetical protein B0H66DRAFT_568308 [Apodospora peruviana]